MNTNTLPKFLFVVALLVISGCASQPKQTEYASSQNLETKKVNKLNSQITQFALQDKQQADDRMYRLGSGDLIEFSVFRVAELDRTVRVDGAGKILVPLLGPVYVAGMSALEAEQFIAQKLKMEYLRDPQVTLFVKEYRSQEIAVMGAVKKPDVYSVTQARSVFELISLAGGLNKNASRSIRIKTRQLNPDTGVHENMDLLLSLDQLLAGDGAAANFRLRGGDSVLVPEAGFVTVEGAVEKPGAYKMEGETNVLKALALAGGLPWTAKQSNVKIIRNNGAEIEVMKLNLGKVRKNPQDDIVLQDGDVVSVQHSASKRAFAGFFKTAGQILGYRIN